MDEEQPPLVSVVTPVRDGVRYIEETLASVREQDYPRVEHVVVDGGSTDGTVEMLSRTPGILWVSQEDRGNYDAVNKGITMASGQIIGYQNADDRYVPDAISTAVSRFAAHPDVDVVYGDFRRIDAQGRPVSDYRVGGRALELQTLLRFNYVPAHSTFLRESVVKRDGHWLNPESEYAGDWEWMIGMLKAGKRFEHVDKVLSEFRIHDRAKSRTVSLRRQVLEWRRIARKFGGRWPLMLWYGVFYVPLRRRLGLPP